MWVLYTWQITVLYMGSARCRLLLTNSIFTLITTTGPHLTCSENGIIKNDRRVLFRRVAVTMPSGATRGAFRVKSLHAWSVRIASGGEEVAFFWNTGFTLSETSRGWGIRCIAYRGCKKLPTYLNRWLCEKRLKMDQIMILYVKICYRFSYFGRFWSVHIDPLWLMVGFTRDNLYIRKTLWIALKINIFLL